MIGNASLRIIVGANFGRTVAGRNHGFTLRTYFVEIFLVFDSINTRTKFNHGFGFVLMLRFFVLALHGDSRRDMHQTNGGIGGIHRLPPLPTNRKYPHEHPILSVRCQIPPLRAILQPLRRKYARVLVFRFAVRVARDAHPIRILAFHIHFRPKR